jgi:hypothetical protein
LLQNFKIQYLLGDKPRAMRLSFKIKQTKFVTSVFLLGDKPRAMRGRAGSTGNDLDSPAHMDPRVSFSSWSTSYVYVNLFYREFVYFLSASSFTIPSAEDRVYSTRKYLLAATYNLYDQKEIFHKMFLNLLGAHFASAHCIVS